MTIEFSVEELKTVRDALAAINVVRETLEIIEKNYDLETLKNRLDSFLGDPCKNLKRKETEAVIMRLYKNDPKERSIALKKLEKDFPLPEAYRH